jgi:hypothetical protein
MVRWLVWTCGGFVAVGVLIRLFSASAADNADQAPAKAGSRPVSSTPASAIVVDPRVQFELNIQKSLIRDGVLSRPPQDAPADVLRAFDLALEAKTAEATDVQAAREAAERVWEEKKAKRDLDRKDRKAKADERMKSEREKIAARHALHQAEINPDDLQRRQARPRPDPVPLPPPFVEDPANPVPKPPDSAKQAPAKR